MPEFHSTVWREHANAVAASTQGLLLITVVHPALAQPYRLCQDNADLLSRGVVFRASDVQVQLPASADSSEPVGSLQVSDLLGDLTPFLEASRGAKGGSVVVELVLRESADVVRHSWTLSIQLVTRDSGRVSARLGPAIDLMNLPFCGRRHDPRTSPGLF